MVKLIAIDFETYLISAEEVIPRPVCLSWADDLNTGLVATKTEMETVLKNYLEDDNVVIIAHNAEFEGNVIDKHFPNLQSALYKKFLDGKFTCTKVYEQHISNIEQRGLHSFALDSLVKKYFKLDISEDKKNPDAWRLRYHELDGIPVDEWPEEAKRYAIDDSKWALKIYKLQQENKLNIDLSVCADFFLNKMGNLGITTDHDRVLLLEKELIAKLTPKYKALEEKGLTQLGINGKYKKNVNNLRAYITENVTALEYTAKGSVAVASEVLVRYLGSLPEDSKVKDTLQNYIDIMKSEKILTAFVSRLKEANPYIRSRYKAVVSSGRTSSSTSQNYPSVNIQQMPRAVQGVTWDIRNCFIPRKGYKIVSIDYAGLELASTAHQLNSLLGMHDMLDTINSGEEPVDMHSMLAYRLMNLKEKTKETYKSFVSKKKEAPYKDYRQLAKPINLGFPGGIGYDTMRTLLARDNIFPKLQVLESSPFENQLTWKRSRCRKEGYPVRIRRVEEKKFELIYDELVGLKQELFGLYPDLEYFLKNGHLNFLTGNHKMMKNEYGEWEKEPMYGFEVQGFNRDWCTYTQLCNGLLMQSPAAIGAKKAMVEIIRRFSGDKRIHPLAFIHDEIVFEVLTNDEMYAIIEEISEIMIDKMQSVLKDVRITVEAEAFDYWKKAGGFYEKTYWKDANNKELKSYGDLVDGHRKEI